MERLREWGFPIGLLLVWAVAAVFTVSKLVGMEAAVERTQVPAASIHVVSARTASRAPRKAPAAHTLKASRSVIGD